MSHLGFQPPILAVYGLAFFVLGLSVAVRAAACAPSQLRQRIFGLAAFGILHGIFEWLALANLIGLFTIDPRAMWAVGAISFLPLYWFALASLVQHKILALTAFIGAGAIWSVAAWYASTPIVLEVTTRLAFGVPAAFAAAFAYGFDPLLRAERRPNSIAALIGGLGFVAYGTLQLFSTPAEFFPASVFNTRTFEATFGASLFLVRAVIAFVIAVCTLALLDRFGHLARHQIEVESARLQKAFVSSEASLARAQRIGNMGSWEWGIATGELIWSDQTFRIFGMRPQEVEASHAAFMECIHADDRRYVEDSVQQAIRNHTRYDIEFRIVLPTGEGRNVHEQGEVEYEPSGQPRRISGTIQDITDRKAAEEALLRSRTLLSGILTITEEAIIVADNDLEIVRFSRGAQRVFGYTIEEVIGFHVEQLFPPRFHSEQKEHFSAFVDELQAGLHGDERGDVTGIRKDGEEFPAAVSLSKLKNGDGFFHAFFIRDVGPENAARDELHAARLAAEESNLAKSSFLANMSHELRTPLNAIIGFSEVIRRGTFGPVGCDKYIEYVGHINESGTHLLKIINDILDLSKIEAGKLKLDAEFVDIAKVVEASLTMVRERAKEGGVTIRADLPDDHAAVYADEGKLKQILVNLTSNSIKFTPSGGEVAIRVSLGADGGYVFQIADTGIGIATEDISAALSPFKQVDSDLNRKFEGTGLGLPLTKSLVEMHGGTLDLQSKVGVGTTVTVLFPAAPVKSDIANLG